MAGETQKGTAEKLRALHAAGMLVLPNAWDAGSAAVIALAGAQAIATTSGGIAWSLGRCDGQRLTRAEMIERVREIVAAVTIPVTADIEGGFVPRPEDVASTVEAVTRAPSFSRAPIGCSSFGLGGSRGDGLWRSLVKGHNDTTAPGFPGAADRLQGDAPQSAG